MNKANRQLIKERYENAVHEYCIAFCTKHEFQYDPDGWVAGHVGGIVLLGDYYVDFDDIRYDIDNDIAEDTFIQYYDYTTEIAMLDEGRGDMKMVNYEHYCKGARPYTAEKLEEIRQAKKRVDEANQALKDCMAAQTDKSELMCADEVCGNCKSGEVQPDGSYCRCVKRNTLQKYLDSACGLYEKGGAK